MENIESIYIEYKDIVKEFKLHEIKKHASSLKKFYQDFCEESGYGDQVELNYLTLQHAVLDFFTDISRIKKFHQIKSVNSFKIVAYEMNWLLRRKPLQVKNNFNKNLLYVNELFVLKRILSFYNDLAGSDFFLKIKNDNQDAYRVFIKNLDFYLTYRHYSSQVIELALLSFCAGLIATNHNLYYSFEKFRYTDSKSQKSSSQKSSSIDQPFQLNRELVEISKEDCLQDLKELYQDFIRINNLSTSVVLHVPSLIDAVHCLYKDIKSHNLTVPVKIEAYKISWLMRRSPLQVIVDNNKNLTYVNEKFILEYVMIFFSKLVGNDFYTKLSEKNKKEFNGYIDAFFYYLKYRNCSANAFELAFMNFCAGIVASDAELSDDIKAYFSGESELI